MSAGTRAHAWHSYRYPARSRTVTHPGRSRIGAGTPAGVARVRHPDRGRTGAGSPTVVAQERSPTEVAQEQRPDR
eukprot:7504963-Alexandrium_andersonii.AAC.1